MCHPCEVTQSEITPPKTTKNRPPVQWCRRSPNRDKKDCLTTRQGIRCRSRWRRRHRVKWWINLPSKMAVASRGLQRKVNIRSAPRTSHLTRNNSQTFGKSTSKSMKRRCSRIRIGCKRNRSPRWTPSRRMPRRRRSGFPRSLSPTFRVLRTGRPKCNTIKTSSIPDPRRVRIIITNNCQWSRLKSRPRCRTPRCMRCRNSLMISRAALKISSGANRSRIIGWVSSRISWAMSSMPMRIARIVISRWWMPRHKATVAAAVTSISVVVITISSFRKCKSRYRKMS